MANLFATAVSALTVVYGLLYGCNQVNESLKPATFVQGMAIDESKEYTVWKESTRMTLHGYELKRRPHDMSIDEFVEHQKTIAQR